MSRHPGTVRTPPMSGVLRPIRIEDRNIEKVLRELGAYDLDGVIVVGLEKGTGDAVAGWTGMSNAELAYLLLLLQREVSKVL